MIAGTLLVRQIRGQPQYATRAFFSRGSAMPQIAIDEEFPNLPKSTPRASDSSVNVQTTVSTTASGVKLASNNADPYIATLGIEVAAGSRTECDATAGWSHLYSRMAFRSTAFRSDLRLYRDIEELGGVIETSSGRDFVRYSISVLPDKLADAAAILAESTLAPRLAQWDIDTQKKKVKIDMEELNSCPAAQVMEAVHAAAFYDDVTLGRPKYSLENLESFNSHDMWNFYEKYINTAQMALVGSGMDHSTLTELANEYFASVPTGSKLSTTAAKFVGGEVRIKKVNASKTHVALGFQIAGKTSSEYASTKVLHALMSLRLEAKKASTFVANYIDAGIIGFTGAVMPDQAGVMVDSFINEMKAIASTAITKEELAAAKNVATFNIANGLGCRHGRLALLGTCGLLQTAPLAKSPSAFVEGVSAKAVQETATKALMTRPALASIGKLTTVPRLDMVLKKLK